MAKQSNLFRNEKYGGSKIRSPLNAKTVIQPYEVSTTNMAKLLQLPQSSSTLNEVTATKPWVFSHICSSGLLFL